MVVFEQVSKEQIAKLKGFRVEPIRTAYEELRLSKAGVTLILYHSGKLLLQGKQSDVAQIAKELKSLKIGKRVEPEAFRSESGWVIGSDETLKGDTFGGLVVAAVKANDELRQKLIELGVKDSKKLHDVEVLRMAQEIKKTSTCEIISLLPSEYNQRKGNVTSLLNQLHSSCAASLHPGKHVVDKYPGCAVGDIQVEQGESKYVEIAAASVLARAAGLKQLDYLSAMAGFAIPKGSSHVKLALQELKDRGLDFREFVKVDFGNVVEFL